ncbi:hybrid sensor histidine kinase/response regulator [Candidatus Chloroploca sp. Khr17]|uniref:ATP-binding response regulator n=1 Tax=Candidatus Chloroploca sp. Khr17 TaxID=2496869 RepID=UPI00101B9480|nr:hybrid sensor histidine kinase/response regulator [Candidatus Chloroploca sp. Khr17]
MGDSLQAASADKQATILELSQLVCSSLDLAEGFERILTAVRDLSLAMTRPVWREAPQRRGILITVITDLQPVPPFAGDAPALREMITNLLLNAVDAMPAGGQLTLHIALVSASASPLRQASALIQLQRYRGWYEPGSAGAQSPRAYARHLLVVEDEPLVRRVLVRQIQRLGYDVTEAAAGATALALLTAHHFDLLCTDLGMPGLSGWELIDVCVCSTMI